MLFALFVVSWAAGRVLHVSYVRTPSQTPYTNAQIVENSLENTMPNLRKRNTKLINEESSELVMDDIFGEFNFISFCDTDTFLMPLRRHFQTDISILSGQKGRYCRIVLPLTLTLSSLTKTQDPDEGKYFQIQPLRLRPDSPLFDLISSRIECIPHEKIPQIVMFHLLNKGGQLPRKEE